MLGKPPVPQDLDFVERYGKSIGLDIRHRTVLVEGTTDVDLFRLAARLERQRTGIDLLAGQFAIVAAGVRDNGGVEGVLRQLVAFRELGKVCLLPSAMPKYRFVGLLDNDSAGQRTVKYMSHIDSSLVEYKDVFRLWPVMPLAGNLTVQVVRNAFEDKNTSYKGLEWEMEDLLEPRFIGAFLCDHPRAARCQKRIADRVHYEWTRDGKADLHRFAKQHAMHEDLLGVIEALRALRFYLGVK